MEYEEVKVASGVLRGKKVVRNECSFYSFQGIPYAKPPLGPLRFKPPQPVECWEGCRDALTEGPVSPQIDFIFKTTFMGEEDCLYLNVYTHKLPENETQRRPVMVFIHGGGLICGSGNSDVYAPDYLVTDVVLVTINYRLGALGFLSLVDASVPGNNGLKDQVAALRWIKQNIGFFGGDPDNVTIFGESAGAASVHYHVLSPMSKGLFHKAIAQSGSALSHWASCSPEQARERTQRLGEMLGCKASDQKELLQFLHTVTAREIVEASRKMMTEEEKAVITFNLFLPVPEMMNTNEEVFLPGYPLDLMNDGKFNHVPYMTGLTDGEGIIFLPDLLQNSSLAKDVDENFEYLLPPEVRKRENRKKISIQVKEHYYGSSTFTEKCAQQHVDFFTHTWLLLGIHEAAHRFALKSSQPVYYYLFEFVGELNFYKKFLKAESLSGASHLDDIGYLFKTNFTDLQLNSESPAFNVLRKMVKLWTNFAKTGNPTSNLDTDINVVWPPLTKSGGKYLKINSDLSVHENLMVNDVDYWQNMINNDE